MRVYNADGFEVGACGNGTRAVARLVMEERGGSRAAIETAAGVLPVTVSVKGYTVDMGRPRFGWDEIPLARPMDTAALDLTRGAPASGLTLDGGTLSTDDLAGRAYVVNFWADWCAPCIGEQPILASASSGHADELAVVGILYQTTPSDATAWLLEHGDAGYPHVIDDDGGLAIDYGVTGPPESYFVDAGGIVRAKQFGPLSEEAMARHMAEIGITE